ncbi:GNAT family N-acetyltransferase, partial [Enterococcus durans]
MHFHEQKCIGEQSLLELYGAVGWTAYTTDSKRLMKAVEQSLKVITVWQEKELIGLIRSVGDGETILYIQDLLVHPAYQKQGIGTELMKQMVEAYPDV